MSSLKEIKKINLTFKQALLPVITMATFIFMAVLIWDVPIHLPIIFQLALTITLALYWGYEWDNIEEMLFSGFNKIAPVLLILLIIGMLIGLWISIGTVPSMIYYGLQVLEPSYFLLLAFIMCGGVSLAIGTAIGTVSTIGLALISIANGMGLPLPMVAGAIISGAYIGDRMSPVSSISILTAHSAGVDHLEMIKHMIYTVLPPIFITAIIYFTMGMTMLYTP